jgi:pimeloyl-ACP methyl ester carboxylesterase
MPFTCGFAVNDTNATQIRLTRVTKGASGIPEGFEIIDSFRATCSGQTIDVTLEAPDNFRNITVLRCRGGDCRVTEEQEVKDTAICAGTPLEAVIREEILRQNTYKAREVKPIVGHGQVISTSNRTVATEGYSIQFIGPLPVKFPARLSSPPEDLPGPTNPSLTIIGTPLRIELDDAPGIRLPLAIQLPVPQAQVEPGTVSIYVLADGKWLPVGGVQQGSMVSTTIDDLNAFLDGGRATFAVMGLACTACTKGQLTSIYDPKSRDAVVLIHGFGSSARTWEPFIAEIIRNRAPLHIFTYSYPFTQPTEKSARELADQLQLQSPNYNRLYLVGHSLGGIVMEHALTIANAEPAQYDFTRKTRAAIGLGTPHDGVPLIRVLEQFAGYLADTPTTYTVFNPKSAAAQEMQQPVFIPRVPGIPYYIIAGTNPLAATANLFSEPNDGVTTVRGAQRLGDTIVNNTCKDFFPIPLTHPELNDEASARRLIARLITKDIAQENPDAILLGYNQYVRIRANACSPDETYVVIGIRIPEEAAAQPLGCGCGNGICGVGETAENCPTDCGRFYSRANLCFALAVLGYIFLIAIIALTIIHIVFVLAKNQEVPEHHRAKFALLVLAVACFIAELIICKYVPILAYVLLLLALLLHVFERQLRLRPQITPTLNRLLGRRGRKTYHEIREHAPRLNHSLHEASWRQLRQAVLDRLGRLK